METDYVRQLPGLTMCCPKDSRRCLLLCYSAEAEKLLNGDDGPLLLKL